MSEANKNGNTILNVPPLRFPEFTDEWERKQLDDIANFSKGYGVSKDQLSETGNPCILYGELYTTYKTETIEKVCSKTNYFSKNLVRSKANDIIIPSSGETAIDISTARCVLLDDIILGGDLNIIRLKKDNGSFLSYQLNGKRKLDIAKIAQGVSIVHLHNEHIKTVNIFKPNNTAEQEKIVKVLSLIDERIETQSQIIKDLKALKAIIMDKIFSQNLQFKDKNGLGYSEWITATLSKISTITMGQSPESSSYNTEQRGLPLVQGNADMQDRKTNPQRYTSKITKTANLGDIIMSVRAPIGTIGLSDRKICCGRGICAIRANNNCQQHFLYQLLLWLEPTWEAVAQGGTFSAINGDDIKNKVISLPCLAQQNEIGNCLKYIDDKIEVEKSILQRLKQQKAYLLSKMFI